VAVDRDPLLDRVIAGSFGLRRMIGAGGSGSVYQADQLALGRTVAVKILRPELTQDPRFARRFHDEALAASRLNHPNVVSVIDYGQTQDGLLYLVMEFLRGQTLARVLEREPLTTARIVDLTAQILAGLEEAHDNGVVHADLKSENIVVEQRRVDWDLVKVVDFGIARLAGTPSAYDGETICGTPEYMAPEVIRGQEPTYASDLYAVGVVIYELMTGATPFAGGTTLEILRRHLGEPPAPPSERFPDAPRDRDLEALALRALAKDPDRRFASAAEFRAAVRAIGQRGSAPAGGRVTCEACGVASPTFKFCPECGHPAGAKPQGSRPPPIAPPVRPTVEDFPVRTLEVATPSGLGLFPLPLVGRGGELAAIVDFLIGPPGALHLVGAVGSGRTRLVDEALVRAGDKVARAVRAGADPSGLARVDHPIREALGALLGVPLDDGAAIGARARELGLGPRDVPGLSAALGHPGPLDAVEPVVRRREVHAAIVRAFQLAGAGRPIAIVFDDVERYDGHSLELVRRLVDLAHAGGLRVLVVSDPELDGRFARAPRRIELPELTADALDALADVLGASGVVGLPSGAELARCGGLPSHLHQIVRYAIEGGEVSQAPGSLADLVTARLDLLPQAARLICQASAVLGTHASIATLAAMVDDGDEVLEALAMVEARGLLVRDGRGGARFEEQLVRDVIHAATPADVRRALHASAAAALVGAGDLTVLGHQLLAAGDRELAVDLFTRAGDLVRERDEDAARRRYTSALGAARELLLQGDEPSARDAFVDVSIKLAGVLAARGEARLGRGILAEARAQVPGGAVSPRFERVAAELYGADGDSARATEALRAAIASAIVQGDRELLCELYLDLATRWVRDGEVDAAIAELGEGVLLVTAGEGPAGAGGPDALWRLCFRRAQLQLTAGDPAEAAHGFEHALRHAARVGAEVGVTRVQCAAAHACDGLGQRERAAELRATALATLRRLGDRRGTAEVLLEIAARAVDPASATARDAVREARTLAREIGWSEGVSRAGRTTEPPPG
jgi:serine/threonine-protein kinase